MCGMRRTQHILGPRGNWRSLGSRKASAAASSTIPLSTTATISTAFEFTAEVGSPTRNVSDDRCAGWTR
jgi:hypothetical protein